MHIFDENGVKFILKIKCEGEQVWNIKCWILCVLDNPNVAGAPSPQHLTHPWCSLNGTVRGCCSELSRDFSFLCGRIIKSSHSLTRLRSHPIRFSERFVFSLLQAHPAVTALGVSVTWAHTSSLGHSAPVILCLDSSFTTRAMLSTSPLKVFHDLSNTVNIQLIFSIFLSRLIFHSNCHHLMCYCFMYLCPVSPFKYKSRKEGILFFYCYTSELRKIPDFRQTLSVLWKKDTRGLQSTRLVSLFKSATFVLVLISGTRFGKSLLRDCSGQTLVHRIRQIDWRKLGQSSIVLLQLQASLSQSPSSKPSLELPNLLVLWHS